MNIQLHFIPPAPNQKLQSWNEVSHAYATLSKSVNVQNYSFHLSDGKFIDECTDWITGLNKIYPAAVCGVVLNWNVLHCNITSLYNIANKLKHQFRFILLTKKEDSDATIATISSYLKKPILFEKPRVDEWKETYNFIKSETWPDCDTPDDWEKLPVEVRDQCYDELKFSPDQFLQSSNIYCKLTDADEIKVIIKTN